MRCIDHDLRVGEQSFNNCLVLPVVDFCSDMRKTIGWHEQQIAIHEQIKARGIQKCIVNHKQACLAVTDKVWNCKQVLPEADDPAGPCAGDVAG